MANDLNSYIERNQKFLKLADGESKILIYAGFATSFDPKNPEKEKVTYKFKTADSDKLKFLTSASIVLAQKMNKVSEGETIKLTRHGIETKTSYDVDSIDDESVPF